MVGIGITAALNLLTIHIFVGGLKPGIQALMLKDLSVLLWDAFQEALTLQNIHMPFKVNLPMVNEIYADQKVSETDREIEAVRA